MGSSIQSPTNSPKKVKCKACGQAFVVPAAVAVAVESPKPVLTKPPPAAVSRAKVPTPEPLALNDDAGPIGLAPDPDEKKPAQSKPSSTRATSTKAIDSAPPLQAETPKKSQAAAKPSKHDAAWESLLNQQNAAVQDAQAKQAEANAKRAAEEKAAALLAKNNQRAIAAKAGRATTAASSDKGSASSGSLIADWMASPFNSWLSVSVAFATAALLAAPVVMINYGAGMLFGVVIILAGGLVLLIGYIRHIIAVFNNSVLVGVLIFVPPISGFASLYGLVAYWHDTRGPFITSMIGVALMFGSAFGKIIAQIIAG